MDIYTTTTTRLKDGRYQVRLPFKNNINEMGDSKRKATAQFLQLEKKFYNNTQIASKYKSFMDEYQELGHMKLASDKSTQEYFLPHHCIIRDSTTTSLRVVFNASQATTNGKSLNDYMHKGPNLQNDLFELILKWRQYPIALTADIEKMFRQIMVHPEDLKYQKILWRDSPRDVLREYELCTVTYGTKAAPFLAMMTLRQLAADERDTHQEAAHVIETSFYMDDLIHGAHSIESALQLKQDLKQLLLRGGFNLRK
ncbi:uncharacterized protein LOC135086309 [Ostrinia nubilalis]|uniref:uncharacterized protein LOC135086309 n=1 Tax=Ostrinia nubilalis TaxID=29057 RepID=UPI00308269AD